MAENTPNRKFPSWGVQEEMFEQSWKKRKASLFSEDPKKAFKEMSKRERASILKEMLQEAGIALGKEEMELVFCGLMDSDWEVNQTAWSILERMRGVCPKSKEALALARECANNSEAWARAQVRKGVMLIIGECGEEKDCKIVWKGLKDSDFEVYNEAMIAFNRLAERGYDLYRFRLA